jgi:hypothetical protein
MATKWENHWARNNRADELSALRPGARSWDTEAEARAEAKTIRPPNPWIVVITVTRSEV